MCDAASGSCFDGWGRLTTGSAAPGVGAVWGSFPLPSPVHLKELGPLAPLALRGGALAATP